LKSSSSITSLIARALDGGAGLARTGPSNGIRDVIDRSLRAAGLTPAGADHATVDWPVRPPPRPQPPPRAPAAAGEFTAFVHTSHHGTLACKLYVPSGYDRTPMPLLVMLHGCKQNPDDFAAGTRMNEFAERNGFLVAYPAQSMRANGSNCWNWFESAHQTRQGAEPSLIAGMVKDIAARFSVDDRRMFVAGLSAGAAMAVILGHTYPEVFSGVAAHSGLPVAAAHNVASAFAAMRQGVQGDSRGAGATAPVRTIVFHGDADPTVSIANGRAIVTQAVAAYAAAGTRLERSTRPDASAGARNCTVTRYLDDAGDEAIEEWVVREGAHAWFGGSPSGSYTDSGGPDASREIVRFLLNR
jgi:poly(hydroxyalkanoate) depolymerase family esterase